MSNSIRVFTRVALWALPVWAILLLLGTLTRQPDPQTEFGAFADYITTGSFLLSHLIASILGAGIGSVGAVALMTYLQDTRAAGRAALGMTGLVLGNTLTSAVFGAAAFAQPAMGRMFQAGAQNAQEFYSQVYGAPLFGTAMVGLVLMITGGILLGAAITASGRLPRWAGWAFAVANTGFVLSSIFFPELLDSAFALVLIAAGAAVAWSATRQNSRQPAGAQVSR